VTIAVTPEQEALRDSVRRWSQRHAPLGAARAALENVQPGKPEYWPALALQGLLGLHIDESYGGGGAGLTELAVVLEELGRSLVSGSVLTTMLAAEVIQRWGRPTLTKDLLPRIVAGEVAIAVGWQSAGLRLTGDGVSGWRVRGEHPAVLGANGADYVLMPASADAGEVWVLVKAGDASVTGRVPLDWTRPVSAVVVDTTVADDHVLLGDADVPRLLAVTLLAAEAAGVAGWCLETASEHARVRHQFGRPIGSFQAVKHRCADMLVAVEQARAAAWDAAVAAADPEQLRVAAAIAGAIAPQAAVTCAKDCIQLLGGIGFTWEHDAHMFLRRATATRQLLGRTDAWRTRVAEHAIAGRLRRLDISVGDDGTARAEVRELLGQARELEAAGQRRFLADHGFLAPHWPAPWGRDAGPQLQLVIGEEVRAAGIRVPPLVMGDWVLPTLIAHGTDEQRERFMRPTLHGDITWCQMFSEPGAGSDLAGLSTRAERVPGGWALTGQKVWTSIAQWSDWAICLARSNPDAPKHAGITYFLVDMSTPGIDIRPLRELTGHAVFNEVFLDQVFVPDDCVVGQIDGGWAYARTTLDSERVAISGGITVGDNMQAVVDLASGQAGGPDGALLAEIGRHVANETALAVLGARSTIRALEGLQSGPTSSVRKLVSAHHKQDVAELGLELLGSDGATMDDGAASFWAYQFLLMRSFTIFGGTSEIQRNVIGERILGLPRDESGTTG